MGDLPDHREHSGGLWRICPNAGEHIYGYPFQLLCNGICCGTIWKPQKHTRIDIGNIHTDEMAANVFAKITGRPPPADATALTPSAFASFEGRKFHPDGTPAQAPRPSKKPFLFFLAAAFGLPYLMGKLIKALAASQEEEQRRLAASGQMQIGPDGQPIQTQIDPSKLDFCRVLYDFTPEAGAAVQGIDLEVKKGDLVAVLSKSDPMGNPSEWWRCRARDGRVGYLPGVYLEVARRPGGAVAEIKSASQSGSRTSSMTSQTKAPVVTGKAGDMSVDSFQKSQFYS